MIAVMLLMFAGGIGLTQAVSDPRQVTLRWLRLGGLIAISLLAAGAVVRWRTEEAFNTTVAIGFAVAVASVVLQLVSAQLAGRSVQRVAAAVAFVAAVFGAGGAMQGLARRGSMQADFPAFEASGVDVRVHNAHFVIYNASIAYPTAATSSGLLGGFLMTMLLGHAYLTAGGEMTQAPFKRLVIMLAVLLALRTACSVIGGLLPWLSANQYAPVAGPGGSMDRMWTTVMLTARYLVGLGAPAVFTYMTHDCVKRRANQSATGILYVAGVLVIIGEGVALAMLGATGMMF